MSTSGGAQPHWRRDGRELFYLAPDRMLMSVDVRGGSAFERGAPKPLFQTRVTDLTDVRNHFMPSADGKRFLVNTAIEEGASAPITVLTLRSSWL